MMATARRHLIDAMLQLWPPSYTADGRLHGTVITLQWNDEADCMLLTARVVAVMAVLSVDSMLIGFGGAKAYRCFVE